MKRLVRIHKGEADTVPVKVLRKVALEELTGAALDLTRIDRPRLQTALARAQQLRTGEIR